MDCLRLCILFPPYPLLAPSILYMLSYHSFLLHLCFYPLPSLSSFSSLPLAAFSDFLFFSCYISNPLLFPSPSFTFPPFLHSLSPRISLLFPFVFPSRIYSFFSIPSCPLLVVPFPFSPPLCVSSPLSSSSSLASPSLSSRKLARTRDQLRAREIISPLDVSRSWMNPEAKVTTTQRSRQADGQST